MKATSHQNRRLIVHAGMHKTGTTALQNYLFHHLDDPRICYLSGGRPNSTPLVRQAFDSTLAPLVRDGSSVAQRRDAARARLNTLVRHSQPVAVLSAEVICALQDEDLGTLFEFFQPHYDVIDAHLYVRPLKSRVESVFQQRLRRAYFNPEQRIQIDYLGNSERFDGVFGRQHVHYHRFWREAFPQGSVVNHFLQQLEIADATNERADHNRSLSLPAVQLLYAYRSHFPQREPADRGRIERLTELTGADFHFHSDLFNRVAIVDAERMRRFERRADFNLTEDEERHNENGIRGEADLLQPDEDALLWLQHAAGAVTPAADSAAIAAQVRSLE